MTAKRELHERVAKANLEDFQDELTKETGTTVSFAMANLPLPADGVPKPATGSRASGAQKSIRPRTPTRPHKIIEPGSPPPMPTAAIPTTELALADGTGAVEPSAIDSSLPPAKKNRTAIVLAILAGAAVLAVIVVLLVRPKSEPTKVAAESKPPEKSQIRVESIPPEEQQPTVEPIIEKPVAEPVVEPVVEKKKPDKKRHGDKKVEAKTEPKVELTKDAVIAKYRAARAAYEAYKAANGGRYDQEWNDLASYVQYHPNELDELARRIESFRATLRE